MERLTMGILLDRLRAIEKAEQEVEKWEFAIARAHNPETVAKREQGLKDARWWLDNLRSEPVDESEGDE